MELPGGRSIPAGDPREQSNPYQDHEYHWREEDAQAARTATKDRLKGRLGQPRFKPHDPSRVYTDHRNMRYSFVDEFAELESAMYRKFGREKSEAMSKLILRNEHDENQASQKRSLDSAERSYYDAKRRRNMGLINQAVAQQVPAQPPYTRSFIPQDLWHLLSPDQ